ncbi:MAG TPA: DNA polymerase III subunit delta' [Burkholderiales bacterium]|nr:DNA polymerase III subunit delta' [Burkholderiales bacterium]
MIHPWNEPILDALARRLERLPHALLIHGPRGVGKRVLAERISQLLLCEGEKRPCDTCDACRWFRGGNHPDFRRVEPEFLWAEKPEKPSLVIKVEQVRELADFLYIGSHRGRLRVALVHPAEEMNENAANALLKGLEEPPAGAIFILVSHRPAQLLPTIRSRCVAVPAPLPPHNIALDWLAREGVTEPQRWLAYAGGAPLRATHYAAQGPVSLTPVGERDGLEPLADALQKIALDRALMAFGLAAKYQTSPATVTREQARAWLAFARRMGEERLLCRHPLNPRLFSAALLTRMPDLT